MQRPTPLVAAPDKPRVKVPLLIRSAPANRQPLPLSSAPPCASPRTGFRFHRGNCRAAKLQVPLPPGPPDYLGRRGGGSQQVHLRSCLKITQLPRRGPGKGWKLSQDAGQLWGTPVQGAETPTVPAMSRDRGCVRRPRGARLTRPQERGRSRRPPLSAPTPPSLLSWQWKLITFQSHSRSHGQETNSGFVDERGGGPCPLLAPRPPRGPRPRFLRLQTLLCYQCGCSE